MGESFLFSIVANLLVKIASLALQEVSLAWGLETDLKKLEECLNTIKAVLLDAEEQQAQNHELSLWLVRLKNFCYDAEDVLDELEYEGLHKQVVRQYGNTKMKVRRFFSSSNPLVFRLKMGKKVQELRERLDEIAYHKSKFHLTELVDYQLVGRKPREMTDSLLHMSNIIGRDDDKERILEFLLHPKEGETFSVIPIVGLGGLGKTTLAKLLYNDERVEKHFDLKIWVCISENFEKKQIMVSMIKSLTLQNRSDLDPDQLQKLIREKLNSKRLLLVLDDVWSDDRGKWIEFLELLEGGAAGSKVIVTTRNTSVARTVGTVSSYNLKGLSHEHCLSLFMKLAFQKGEEVHPHLMEIGNDIVKKCGGLPLAVRTVGTLLYLNSDERYWQFIRDSETWKLEQKENDILPALKLSYDQLPSYLKPCFALCSLYSKDNDFNSIALAQLWMAHGLLQPSNGHQDIEDIGLRYMKELYSRSFLQDFEEHGDLLQFKLHDLAHDLALSVAQSECSILNTHIKNVSDGIRHLSFSEKALLDQEVPNFLKKKSSLRTIIFPLETQGPSNESFVNTCISKSKYLRMLKLERSFFEVLPSSIGGLKHLRYLNLTENRRIKRLPHSLWKLHNLETLFLGGCSELEKLPRDIRNLIKLRVLEITVKQKCLPDDRIRCLRSLRVLSVGECSNLEFLFDGIQHLTSLHHLTVWKCENLVSLPRNLRYLTALKVLQIKSCKQFNWIEEDDSQDIRLSLQSLWLEELPQVMTLPQWLQKSFKTLQSLEVINCENFSSFPEWFQDFSSLKTIVIEECPKLFSLQEGINHLPALK